MKINNFADFEKNLDFPSVLVYDGINTSDGGVYMASKEYLDAVLRETKCTQAEAAKKIGWTPLKLNQKLVRNTLRADDFINLLDALGVEVKLIVKETEKPIKIRIAGAGRRVRRMVDKVTYDTALSNAISNNFYADGVNEYNNDGTALELYVDSEGRYFFAEYSNWEGGKDKICPVTANDAAEFIKKYGTTIHKQPEEKNE